MVDDHGLNYTAVPLVGEDLDLDLPQLMPVQSDRLCAEPLLGTLGLNYSSARRVIVLSPVHGIVFEFQVPPPETTDASQSQTLLNTGLLV